MLKEVKYSGFTTSPTGYECSDGELDISMNFIREDGALKTVLPPQKIYQLSGGKLVYIHQTSGYCNHIWAKETNQNIELLYVDGKLVEAGNYTSKPLGTLAKQKLPKITAIGNILVVLCEYGIQYYKFSTKDKKYDYLGNKVPDISLQFSLAGHFVHRDPVLERPKQTEIGQSELDWFRAELNTLIHEQHEQGRFLFPFFIRYAIRLAGESNVLVNHSAPILMLDSKGMNPAVFAVDREDGGRDYNIAGISHDLSIVSATFDRDEFNKWEDIISSVEIYVSAPIYTYSQNGVDAVERDMNTEEYLSYTVCRMQDPTSDNYTYHTLEEVYNKVKPFPNTRTHYIHNGHLNRVAGQIEKDLNDCSQFYLLTSIPLSELGSPRIVIPKGYLDGLQTRPVMTDEFRSHDNIIAETAYVYNSRLNLANISRRLFGGFSGGIFPYFTDWDGEHSKMVEISITIETNKGRVILAPQREMLIPTNVYRYYYYPNPNAVKLYIKARKRLETAYQYSEVSLKTHDFLSGSYALFKLDNLLWKSENPNPGSTTDATMLIEKDPNMMMTSEVMLPFVFPLTGINRVGTGEVIGLSSAVKALSQGQFGQFPMYVFTSEGVWAMEISATGTFRAKQPVSRDVCISADSITQVDGSVLFATERGIMMLAGSESQCITDMIDRKESINLTTMLDRGELLATISGIPAATFDMVRLKDFIADSRMIYDYANQRLIIYSVSYIGRVLLFSFKTKSWSFAQYNIQHHVNSFTEPLATDNDGWLLNLSNFDDEYPVKSVLLTRPLKLDAPDMLKTIDKLIHRGHFALGSMTICLWGSSDLENWQLIYATQSHFVRGISGTPFKYFRIGLVCDSGKCESISGVSISYRGRMLNDLR